MDGLSLIAVAVALAMDAFAVAVATGMCLRQAQAAQTLRMAGAFGLAVKAGRAAYLAGTGATRQTAEASSPLTGFLGDAK